MRRMDHLDARPQPFVAWHAEIDSLMPFDERGDLRVEEPVTMPMNGLVLQLRVAAPWATGGAERSARAAADRVVVASVPPQPARSASALPRTRAI
jgi:hypothetical protein